MLDCLDNGPGIHSPARRQDNLCHYRNYLQVNFFRLRRLVELLHVRTLLIHGKIFCFFHNGGIQGKVEERNADYWRIVNTLEQEIPPAWITHAARKRARRYLSEGVATPARVDITTAERPGDPSGAVISDNGHAGQHTYAARPGGSAKAYPQTVFGGCVDRIFFFGDLNYRIDLSREDLELGLSAAKMKTPWGAEKSRYPGLSALDSLLDFDQLTLVRAQGKAFKGFSEGRLTFEPTYKYDKAR